MRKSHIALLMMICTMVTIIAAITACRRMYKTAVEQNSAWLLAMADAHTELMEAVFEFDASTGAEALNRPPEEASLHQLRSALAASSVSAEQGELVVGRRSGESIEFLASSRFSGDSAPVMVPFEASDLAVPMRRALLGERGTTVAADYQGEVVLAAFRPMRDEQYGLVVKTSLRDMQAPYLRTTLAVAALALVLVLPSVCAVAMVSRWSLKRLQASEAGTRRAEVFLRASLDALSAHVVILDTEGRIEAVNRPWLEFAAANGAGDKQDYVGCNYLKVCERSGIEMASCIRAVMQGEKTRCEHEYECHSPTEKRWFVAHVSAFDEPCPRRVVISHENITRRVEATQRLREAKEASEVANRAKSDFLAVMSHEMRTPLNPILGYSDLLIEDLDDPEHRESVRIIRQSSEHLLRLVDQILNYSRLDRNTATSEPIDFEPLEELSTWLERHRPVAGSTELRLENGVPGRAEPIPESLMLSADKTMIGDILHHLLDNACKYTPEDGTVVLRAGLIPKAQDVAELLIEVEDNGIGMPDFLVERIFEPFTQADTSYSRRHGGAGLGLAICHKLIGILDASVEVVSRPGEGSLFRVSIPCGLTEVVS